MLSPIPSEEGIEIFNPAVADPLYRVAIALEKLVDIQVQSSQAMNQLYELLVGRKEDGKSV